VSDVVAAITLVPGASEGPTFVLREPLSFWGGLEAVSGRIVDRWHPQKDQVIAGHILVMAAGRGSSSGSSVLAEAIRLGSGPAGIVLLSRDAIVTTGAMVAAELYGRDCPVVLPEAADWPAVTGAIRLRIEARGCRAEIHLLGPSVCSGSLLCEMPQANQRREAAPTHTYLAQKLR
jgi:predicted aconitase with swiveling domain